MTQAKAIIIRDDGTEIKAVAIRPDPQIEVWRKAGYGADQPYALLANADGHSVLSYDPHTQHNRTMYVAHRVLQEHWDRFEDGDELDVRDYFTEFLREFFPDWDGVTIP